MQARMTIQSFDWRTLQYIQRVAPEIPTFYPTSRQRWLDNVGRGPATPWTAGFALADHGSVPKMIRAAGGKVWSSFHGDLDAAQVKEAQALGLQVLAWTVNRAEDMRRMLDLGVDGVVTDRPDVAMTVWRERGLVW